MDFTAYLKALVALLGGSAVVAVGTVVGIKWLAERWFERRFESHKADLDRHTEYLKHGLEREMLKAQLSTSKVHEVYPSLYGRILRAHGAVSDLIGGRLEQTYQDYDRDDFDELLRRKCLPNSERERLLDAIGAEREKGIRELHYALRRVQIHNARTEIMKASNFRILKGLYLSRPVQALTSQILTSVSTSWAEIQTEFEIEKRGRVASQGNPFEKLQEVLGKVDQLQQLMQKELEPMELQKHLATSASIANRVPRD